MISKSFLVFGIGGGIGFLVDAVVFALLHWALESPYLVRVGSFLGAVTTTWAFNRRYAFGVVERPALDRATAREWWRYLVSQLSGFMVNYLVFSALVFFVPPFSTWPVAAVAAGSLSGLVVNYSAARLFVYRRLQTAPKARR